jgi:hypothetical protein
MYYLRVFIGITVERCMNVQSTYVGVGVGMGVLPPHSLTLYQNEHLHTLLTIQYT